MPPKAKTSAAKTAPVADLATAEPQGNLPAGTLTTGALAPVGQGPESGTERELIAGMPAAPAGDSGHSVEGSAPGELLIVEHQDGLPGGSFDTDVLGADERTAVHGVRIRSVPESFRRCGRRFTREGTDIALEDLDDEHLDQLFEDPNLVCEHTWLTEPVRG